MRLRLARDPRQMCAPRALSVDERAALEGVDERAPRAARWQPAGDLDRLRLALLAGDEVEDRAAEEDRVPQARREAGLGALAQAPGNRRPREGRLPAEPLRRAVGQPRPAQVADEA